VDESTIAFVYDGWNLISEISNLPSQIESSKNYVWGIDLSGSLQGAGGINGLLSQMHTDSSGSSQVFHYTYDLNGNVSEVLDGSGAIAAHYEYGPFGEVLREAYQSLEVRRSLGEGGFRFSTKYYDTELKTYYYGYRYYDPSIGRWLNRDPIEESGEFVWVCRERRSLPRLLNSSRSCCLLGYSVALARGPSRRREKDFDDSGKRMTVGHNLFGAMARSCFEPAL
jgi:RHS repeat-associated protein